MKDVVEVMSPLGVGITKKRTIARRLGAIEGKTICETWNLDFRGDVMFSVLRELLKKRYPGVKIIPHKEFPSSPLAGSPTYQREMAKKIAAAAKERGCDALISGNGG